MTHTNKYLEPWLKKFNPRQKNFNSRTNEGLSPTLTTSPTLAHHPMLTQIDLGKVMDYFPVQVSLRTVAQHSSGDFLVQYW